MQVANAGTQGAWKRVYQDALFEKDRKRLAAKLQAAQKAIDERLYDVLSIGAVRPSGTDGTRTRQSAPLCSWKGTSNKSRLWQVDVCAVGLGARYVATQHSCQACSQPQRIFKSDRGSSNGHTLRIGLTSLWSFHGLSVSNLCTRSEANQLAGKRLKNQLE